MESIITTIATIYHNIGTLYLCLKDYPKALDFCLKSLNSNKSTMGADHIYTANSYSSLGLVYQSTSDYKQAIEAYTMALSIYEKASSNESFKMGCMHSAIALMYEKTGDCVRSAKFYEKSLKKMAVAFGEESFVVLQVYVRLAKINSKLGNSEKSLKLYHQIIELSNKIDHQDLDTVDVCSNLATVYLQKQDYKKAKEFCIMGISICEEISGEDNPGLGLLLFTLAEIYEATGDKPRAMYTYSKALSGIQETLGYDHSKSVGNIEETREGMF